MVDNLLVFAVASLLASMVPGPTTVVVMRQSMRFGSRAGVATVLGNETGWLMWSVAAALGLSALLLASQLAYDVMRVAGAAVLLYFGAKALWQAGRTGSAPSVESDAGLETGMSPWRSYRIGLLANLANPKAGVFAMAFLPQFVPQGAPVPASLLLLAVLSTMIDLVWYLGIVRLVGVARRFLQRPAVRRRLEYVSGVALIALALRLATEAR